MVVIDFGNGYAALYLHLAQQIPPRLAVGQMVSQGQLIGYGALGEAF